jgi:hypothetical protein
MHSVCRRFASVGRKGTDCKSAPARLDCFVASRLAMTNFHVIASLATTTIHVIASLATTTIHVIANPQGEAIQRRFSCQ